MAIFNSYVKLPEGNSSSNMTNGINDGNNICNNNPCITTTGIIVITDGIND